MAFQTINPTINAVIKSFDETNDVALEKYVAQATTTFNEWKNTDYQTRSQLLYTVAGLLRAKRRELAQTITLEMGKLPIHAESEIRISAEI
jgi:succinate-semialdehyde dehydrogenase/glutarate-semialdehyde dehydrogenase